MHTLKDVLLLNSRHNIISEPTRQLALLDPIILHEDMLPLIQGIIRDLPDISDHCAAYVYLPIEYPVHGTVTGNIWMYKNAIVNCLIKSSPILTDHVFVRVVLMQLVHYSQKHKKKSLNLQKCLYRAKMGLDATKPVFGVSEKARLTPVSSATQTI